VDASEDGPFEPAPFEPAPNPVDRDQTLLEDLVWFVGSVTLIGGVVVLGSGGPVRLVTTAHAVEKCVGKDQGVTRPVLAIRARPLPGI